jgi:hypothetical protein
MLRNGMLHSGMFPLRISVRRIPVSGLAMVVGAVLLASPWKAFAQHGGGGGGRGMMSTGSGLAGGGRPDGIDEKDALKDFHRAMAVQASPEQRAAFTKVAQYTQAASDQLQAFRESLQKVPASSPLPDRAAGLEQAIARARAGNQNFLASFSTVQKSGLKDITGKLEKADSELDKQAKMLDQIVQAPKPETEQVVGSSAALDKALASFQNEQFSLGGEMSIIFPASGQSLAFSLPQITNSIDIAGQSVTIPASGAVSRTSLETSGSESGHNLFSFRVVADLSDLQQNITGLLRSALTRSPRCGERVEVQDASFLPRAPASLVMAHLHFEHWICPPGASGQSPTELASGDGEIEIKLTPSIDHGAIDQSAGSQSPGLVLTSEISRVEADAFIRNSLRSGDLGVTIREQVAASVLSVLQKGVNPKESLPPVAKELATVQKAQFEDDGADQLSLVLDGQMQFSDEQAKQFATQLNQPLSAKQTSP